MQKINSGDQKMFIVLFRALILYAIVFIVIRLMGKKELSKVQPFELAIIVVIADLSSAPMSSRGISIFDGIVPIIALLIMYILFSLITHSSNKIEDVVCGTMSTHLLRMKDGKIVEEEFKKHQYTLADIMTLLRDRDVFKIQDVKYGIVETNGNLSVIKFSDGMDRMPLNVIEDGSISNVHLNFLGMSEDDLNRILKDNNVDVNDILIGTIDENNDFIFQLKGEVKK